MLSKTIYKKALNTGTHGLGMMLMSSRSTMAKAAVVTSNTRYFSSGQPTVSAVKPYEGGENLPRAPLSVYRKRPVKLIYDKNDYHMFRLPSEKQFLLGSYDYEDLFGQRKGTNHSPHIRA